MFSTFKKNFDVSRIILGTVIIITLSFAVTACDRTGGLETAAQIQAENKHIRIEFTTTGDYANLQIYNPELIHSVKLESVSGNPSYYDVTEDGLVINQPTDDAQQGTEAGITVDFEIAMDTGDTALDFRLQCSPINSSLVRIYHLINGEHQLVHEEKYQRSLIPVGYLHKDFSFDLNGMAAIPPRPQASPTPYQTTNHVLRIELSATSDYALFRILQPEHVLSVHFIETSGKPSSADYCEGGMGVGQPINSAKSGEVAGLTVDFEIDLAANSTPLDFQLQSGELNGSSAKIYNLVGGDFQLVHETEYRRSEGTGGRKFHHIAFDLNTMGEVPATSGHCSLYDDLDLDIVLHTIEPDDNVLKMYAKFPSGVIGVQGEDNPVEYIAQLGDNPSLECRVYEGDIYYGRLYCYHGLQSEDKNSNQPWSLFVSGCEEAIFKVPLLSLQVTKPEKAEEKVPAAVGPCGPEPDNTPCSIDYEDWCHCQGGQPVCAIVPNGQNHYCFTNQNP